MTIILSLIFFFGTMNIAEANADNELFIVITSADAETQMMAMVLATQSANQDVTVRILLCSEAGNLAIEGYHSPAFAPVGRSPKQLLTGLIERGVTVEVCGIFLPNRDYSDSDLIPNVGTANPAEVAAYMKQDNVRYFTF